MVYLDSVVVLVYNVSDIGFAVTDTLMFVLLGACVFAVVWNECSVCMM